MPSCSELMQRFRSAGLEPADRDKLLTCIEDEADPLELAGLLYAWGYTYPEHPIVLLVCKRHIEVPTPGLTSTCLKVVCDYWGRWQEHERDLARYLDFDLFEEEWYDEVIVAFRFVSQHPYGWPRETLVRFARLEGEAERLELTSLL